MVVSWLCKCIVGACDTGVCIPDSAWVSESGVNAYGKESQQCLLSTSFLTGTQRSEQEQFPRRLNAP